MSQETLPKYDLEELARPMIALLDESRDQTIGQLKTHQLLLEGKPVSPEQIAAHLGLTQGEVADLLKGAELNQEGNLVGLGLSIVPTPHSYRIHGRQLYTWCAFDAIMFPIFHRANVEIESIRSAAKGSASPARQRAYGMWIRSRRSCPGLPEKRAASKSALGSVTTPTSSPRLKRQPSMSSNIRGW